jgi:hypothetical protein
MIVIKFSEISHHYDQSMQVVATSIIHRVHNIWYQCQVSSVCGMANVSVVHHGWKIMWCTTSPSGHTVIVI